MRVTEVKLIQNNKRAPGQKWKPTPKTRVYFFPQGESLIESLMQRRTRPYNEYRKLIPGILQDLGVTQDEFSRLSIGWRQNAGCSCGCSPGFIVDGWSAKLSGFDVYVTLEA